MPMYIINVQDYIDVSFTGQNAVGDIDNAGSGGSR